MRTFVALNLPAAERRALHDSVSDLAQRGLPVRWTPADNLHLTIRFLGEIEGAEIPRLEEALRAVSARHRPVTLELGGLGAFPSLRRANVIWIGVTLSPELAALHQDAELTLSRLGYPREPKPYRPHITLARTRGGARPPDVERLLATHSWKAAVAVSTLDLMRSHTAHDGAKYEPLLRLKLGAETSA